MSTPYANYEVLSFDTKGATYDFYPFDTSNYRTATTVHQLYCLTKGALKVYPMAGPPFNWPADPTQSIDVLCYKVEVADGTFIGFRARFDQNPFYGKGNHV